MLNSKNNRLKKIGLVIKNTGSSFSNDKVLKLSAALSYYTIFSLSPLIIVLISLCGIFFSKEALQGKVYGILVNFMGSETAFQLQDIIKNASKGDKSFVGIIGVGIVLLFGATSIFGEIQDSINLIWGLKAKPKKN